MLVNCIVSVAVLGIRRTSATTTGSTMTTSTNSGVGGTAAPLTTSMVSPRTTGVFSVFKQKTLAPPNTQQQSFTQVSIYCGCVVHISIHLPDIPLWIL